MLGLVVLREDLELLHRVLRERGAAAAVLSDHAAVEHVVLVAHAVDEDVDRLGVEAARRDLLASLVLRYLDARREVREVEEVALVLGQVPHLLGGHAGGDLGRLRFNQQAKAAGDLDLLGVDEVGGDPEVQRNVLPHQQLDRLRLGLVLGQRDLDLVRARWQPVEREGPLVVGHGLVGETAVDMTRDDRRTGQPVGVVGHCSRNGRGGGLRRHRAAHEDVTEDKKTQVDPESRSSAHDALRRNPPCRVPGSGVRLGVRSLSDHVTGDAGGQGRRTKTSGFPHDSLIALVVGLVAQGPTGRPSRAGPGRSRRCVWQEWWQWRRGRASSPGAAWRARPR
jgi:hypothetical protein